MGDCNDVDPPNGQDNFTFTKSEFETFLNGGCATLSVATNLMGYDASSQWTGEGAHVTLNIKKLNTGWETEVGSKYGSFGANTTTTTAKKGGQVSSALQQSLHLIVIISTLILKLQQ